MSEAKSGILISFAFIWFISLFVLALGAQDTTVSVSFDTGFIHHYLNLAYDMVPPNAVLGIAGISLLLILRYLFKL